MSVLLAIANLIIISFLLKFIYEQKSRRSHQILKQFPSHPTYPLIGNLHLLFSLTDGLFEKIEKVLQPFDRQVFRLGPIPILILKNHADIAAILEQCQDRDTTGLADLWFGQGIITARYEEWKKSRRMLIPAFNSKMLSKYLQVFNRNASSFAESLKSVADNGEEVDVLQQITQTNLCSIIENTSGIAFQNRGKSERDFCVAILAGLASIFHRISNPFLIPNCIYKLYSIITRKTRAMEYLKFYTAQVLRQTLNEYKGFPGQNNTMDEENTPQTVVNLLIKRNLKEPDFSETRMIGNLLQLIVAGVEPIARNLSFLLLMLAINQDVQQKVYKEITQLPASQDDLDGALAEKHLTNGLGYLEQCIKETLRLFSPVAHDIRRTHKEIMLGDKIIPANTLVATFTYASNRDSKLYSNPLKWDPEHFSDEAVQKRPKTSFLSFGYGPKYCLGAKYAMMCMKIEAVFILRRYHLSTKLEELTNNDLYVDLAIKSKRGYPVQFTSRR